MRSLLKYLAATSIIYALPVVIGKSIGLSYEAMRFIEYYLIFAVTPVVVVYLILLPPRELSNNITILSEKIPETVRKILMSAVPLAVGLFCLFMFFNILIPLTLDITAVIHDEKLTVQGRPVELLGGSDAIVQSMKMPNGVVVRAFGYSGLTTTKRYKVEYLPHSGYAVSIEEIGGN